MTSANPFDLLGDDDNDDPSQLLASRQPKLAAAPHAKKSQPPAKGGAAGAPAAAKMPSRSLPPTQAVREAKGETGRVGFRAEGRGYAHNRDAGGFNRDSFNNEIRFNGSNGFPGGYNRASEFKDNPEKPSEQRYGGPRVGARANRRDVAEAIHPRRLYDRRSGTGRGNEIKRDGSGLGNWGSPTDEIAPDVEEAIKETEKNWDADKQFGVEDAADPNKENSVKEAEKKEEDREMTLEEYEKVVEEKRKALSALKAEERKVNVDQELQSMQQLSSKKGNDDIYIKLGSEKDKRKEADKEDKVKKSVSINEFLKPAGGERHYSSGRGRGRGSRGGYGSYPNNNVAAPAIEDRGQFPTLAAK